MSLADKDDSSDLSSQNTKYNISEQLSMEVELKDHSEKNEHFLFDEEEVKGAQTKHNLLFLGSTPASQSMVANTEDFHYDAHHSLHMNGNQGMITRGNADEFQWSSSTTKRQQEADRGYVADNNCFQGESFSPKEMESKQTAEVAQSSNAFNDSGYISSPEGNLAIPASEVPHNVIDLSSSDKESLGVSVSHSDYLPDFSSHLATHPHTLQSGYPPNTSEVVPTGMPSSYSSHGAPKNHEHIDALDEVDIRSGSISRDRYLGPATGYQVLSATLCASDDTNHGYVCNDSSEFKRLGRKSVSMSLSSLDCNTTIEEGMRIDKSECLKNEYLPNTSHSISEPPTSRLIEDNVESCSSGTFVGLSKVKHQSREVSYEQGLVFDSNDEDNVNTEFPIPSVELPQENYVQIPVNADTLSSLSLSADNASIDSQSVHDSVINTTEDSEGFLPDCLKLEYEPCFNYHSESEAVRKCREGYICSDLTIASERVQFYFPYEKASLCRTSSFDQCDESSGVGSSPSSLSEHSPDNLNTCHFHFEYPLQTLTNEKCLLTNSVNSSNESISESPIVSSKSNKPLHFLYPSSSSTEPIEK